MPKSYLRYVQKSCFGVIASTPGEILLYPGSNAQLVLSSSLEVVNLWNIRQGLLVGSYADETNQVMVTCMAVDSNHKRLAVGYEDGRIRVYELASRELIVVFNAHSSAVTCLRYNPDGNILASGSQDTEIVLWDVIAESGLFRLKGHKGEITDLAFLRADPRAIDPNASNLHIGASADATAVEEPSILGSSDNFVLISSSKDSLIKIWDLEQQHCLHTLTGHRGEVWSFDVMKRPTDPYALLVAGSIDRNLRVWKIPTEVRNASHSNPEDTDYKTKGTEAGPVVEFVGMIERAAGRKRVHRVRFDNSASGYTRTATNPEACLLFVQSSDRVVDIFTVRPVEDRQKRYKRRVSRAKERLQRLTAAGDTEGIEHARQALEQIPKYVPSDDLEAQVPVRAENRVVSGCIVPKTYRAPTKDQSTADGDEEKSLAPGSVRVIVSLETNCIQAWEVPLKPLSAAKNESSDVHASSAEMGELKVLTTIELPGHRGGIRQLALSSDDSLLLSASGNQIKLWNTSTASCIRTLEIAPPDAESLEKKSGHARVSELEEDEDEVLGKDSVTSAVFVPGARQIIVGTKLGYVDLYDLASGALLSRERAHDGQTVWALELRADQRGFVTGGGQEVWFWDLELYEVEVKDEVSAKAKAAAAASGMKLAAAPARTVRRLGFSHTRTLKVSDDVLCLKCSPDGRYVAVGLLDGTVRIFYEDSLSFYLSLYGHKHPVLSLDITSDSTLIITGSADKTVKIWGLDFGDCHRSLIAHDGSVMKVQCVPKTHYFFSVGKDKLVKYWDADKFEQILRFKGHHAEVFALTVASKGQFFITGGNDRSIRLWKQTNDQVFLEEEKQKLLEEALEAEDKSRPAGDVASSEAIGAMVGGLMQAAADSSTESWRGVRTSKDALAVSETLMEALDIVTTEEENWKRYHELVKTQQKRIEAAEYKLAQLKAGESLSGLERAIMSSTQSAIRALETELEELRRPVVQPTPHIKMMGQTPTQFILRVIRSTKTSELTEALVTLSYEYAIKLLKYLTRMLEQGLDPENCVKLSLLILKIHQTQVISSRSMIEHLAALRRHSRLRLTGIKDTVGTNLAALQYLAQDIKSSESQYVFGEPEGEDSLLGKRKKKYNTVAARRRPQAKLKRVRQL